MRETSDTHARPTSRPCSLAVPDDGDWHPATERVREEDRVGGLEVGGCQEALGGARLDLEDVRPVDAPQPARIQRRRPQAPVRLDPDVGARALGHLSPVVDQDRLVSADLEGARVACSVVVAVRRLERAAPRAGLEDGIAVDPRRPQRLRWQVEGLEGEIVRAEREPKPAPALTVGLECDEIASGIEVGGILHARSGGVEASEVPVEQRDASVLDAHRFEEARRHSGSVRTRALRRHSSYSESGSLSHTTPLPTS